LEEGKVVRAIASSVGGKGGGRPDNAGGGDKEASKLAEAVAKAIDILKAIH